MRIAFIAGLIYFLFFSTSTLAQQREWVQVFFALLGEIPRPCLVRITPKCFSCLIYTKLFPLLFFLAIFFLVFYYIVKLVKPAPAGTPLQQILAAGVPQLEATEMKIIGILSTIFSLILLHIFKISTILTQFTWWISLTLFVFGIMVARSIFRIGGVFSILVSVIITIIVLAGIWAYIGGALTAAIDNWIRMCAR